MFNFFKHKRKSESNTYEGRIITDNEFKEMIRPKTRGFVNDELDEINKMIEELKSMGMKNNESRK